MVEEKVSEVVSQLTEEEINEHIIGNRSVCAMEFLIARFGEDRDIDNLSHNRYPVWAFRAVLMVKQARSTTH